MKPPTSITAPSRTERPRHRPALSRCERAGSTPGGVTGTTAGLRAQVLGCLFALLLPAAHAATWTADNGNGTYSNPLFYEDFSDPDIVRVGDDYYLTGSSMHVMPGLPVLHSTDLVNWTLASYAFDRLDLGPDFHLGPSQDIYGKGIWAPCLRYHDGTFYLFANVNGHGTQLFRARSPSGPWTHLAMKCTLHDLSVLFDDDGKVYAVWGYQDLRLAELNADFTDIVPGTERTLFAKDAGMGEGAHFYKIDGRYYIVSALWAGPMRMACARADRPEGPYEVKVISIDEDLGLPQGWRLRDVWGRGPLQLVPPDPTSRGRMSLHQGGIVSTPSGEWWGFSMMDANAIGRWTCLSPVTWQDGWPWFGLPGNLTRTPRTWIKPASRLPSPPTAPFERSDDFSRPGLNPVWQWNHVPDDHQWSLTERPGFLRLHALPAADFFHARNTLTQKAVGPQSDVTVAMDVAGLRPGDVAGLGLLSLPYAWIGVRRGDDTSAVDTFDQGGGQVATAPLPAQRVWLRVHCDFQTEQAEFSFSLDGKAFQVLGTPARMVFQLKTFQGIRLSLFNFNTRAVPGGYADFDTFTVDEPRPRGLSRPIPLGHSLRLTTLDGKFALLSAADALSAVAQSEPRAATAAARFIVVDRGQGRIAFRAGDRFLSVSPSSDDAQVILKPGPATDAESFQWIESLDGNLMLLSLATHRYVRIAPGRGEVLADAPGIDPDAPAGCQFRWEDLGESAKK